MLEDLTLAKLKKMSIVELKSLCDEIRQEIIDVTSQNGGHLASNLGIVELTVALHYVFDSPTDKLIFDVSHQTYAHKLLTGRVKEFKTLRTYQGISGFAKYNESVHDAFEGGHSSTSISAGLGFLEAKKCHPDQIGEVVAIVGDASIANGLCFEALNYLGEHKDEKMIIIFNDNNMSISPNVGVLAKRYNAIRTKNIFRLLKKITPVRIKHLLQYWAYHGDIFTSMNYKYYENIDGHDLAELIKYLTIAKNMEQSVVIHVQTKKGKGYKPAEEDALGLWHGVGPFNKATGEFLNQSSLPSFGNVLSDHLCEMCAKDEFKNLRILTPAMLLGSGLTSFAKMHPDKFIDVGIAEENAMVMASSMALSGLVPVIFIYSTFLQRAFDELHHDVARTNQHVVLCIDRAGIVPGDGDTHQGIYDLAYLGAIPNVLIFHPTGKQTAALMLEYAVKATSGVVAIRYPKGDCLQDDDVPTSFLKWNIKGKSHRYALAYGINARLIEAKLTESKLDIGMIYVYSSVIDDEALKAIDGSILYIYEEVIKSSSYAMKVLMRINELGLNIKLKAMSLEDTYLMVGTTDELKQHYHLTLDDFIALINE